MSKGTKGKIIFSITLLCYVAAVVCAVLAGTLHVKEVNDPHRAALLAAMLYFVCCGVILQLTVRIMRGGNHREE